MCVKKQRRDASIEVRNSAASPLIDRFVALDLEMGKQENDHEQMGALSMTVQYSGLSVTIM